MVFSGLPGVGKSAIAEAVGSRLPAAVISVDIIETAILRSGIPRSFETGLAAYEVGAALGAQQLRLGMSAIADAANDLEVGRSIWRAAALGAGATWRVIEIVCSDPDEHRRRLERRHRQLEPFPEPTWEDVLRRRAESEPWDEDRLTVDSCRSVDENVARILGYLGA